MMTIKVCSKCKEQKTISEFEYRPSKSTYRGQCRECRRAYKRTLLVKNGLSAAHLESMARWRDKNRAKTRAKDRVRNAIRDGRMNKGTVCIICGSTEHIEGHHKDYNNVFQVDWLCRKHHHAYHNYKNYGYGSDPYT